MNLLNVQSPGDLFSGDRSTLKSEFDKLALKYHPDHNGSPKAAEEFIHLMKLYELAQKSIEEDYWESSNGLKFSAYRIKFMRKVDFELGKMYVGDTHVTFLIEKCHEELWNNAQRIIKGFKYSSDRMKKEISRYLPSIKATTTLPNFYVLVINKTPDLILLKDVPTQTIPEWDKHVAWIISTLHNLMCYFEFAGITHNDISLDTLFISPQYHSGALLGGWWYAREYGKKLLAVPAASYEFFSHLMKKTKIADPSLDKELVRALGRELLGDRGGTKLLGSKVAPVPFINWLRCATSKTAVKEYDLWDKVIIESYGKKKFVPLNITAKTIYKGE
jgi:hypothetical protein